MDLLNSDALDKIADNFKNIIDGGSEDIKKAMEAFDTVSNKL